MLTFFLDKHNKTPLYEQLYQEIKQNIINNELKADEKLPSKRKLAQHLKVSVITVENAYHQLIAEGYIKSKPKSGFFVLPLIDLMPPQRNTFQQAVIEKVEKDHFLIDFRTNLVDTDYFPYDKMAKIEKEVIQYEYKHKLNDTNHLGDDGLRLQISKLLFEYRGISAKPESIVIGSGSENLIALLVMLLGRDKVYGVEEPGYLKNYQLYQNYGASSKTFRIEKEGINTDLLTQIDVVHITPSHQFPLGIVMPISKRIELLNWVNEDQKRYIIEDDYDSEFRFSGKPIPALKSLDHMNKVIYLNSFSKSIAPSYRVSFMVLPDYLMNRFNQQFSHLICSVPIVTQLTLERFIRDHAYEKHLSRMKNIYKLKRDILIDHLKRANFKSKISIKGEESGLHFLLDISTKLDIDELIDRAKQKNVRLYGIHEYYLNKHDESQRKTLVMGYSHMNEKQLKKAVELLESAWKDI